MLGIEKHTMANDNAITGGRPNGSNKRDAYSEFFASAPSTTKPLVSSWLPTVETSLSSLLRWAGAYPAHIQDSHLAFAREAVVPRLKQPDAADVPHYILTHDHAPYEASAAFASHQEPRVRFTVQPLVDPSPPAGDDPLGQKGLREKLEGFASACGADRLWLDAFIDSVFLTPEETKMLISKNIEDAADALPRQACYAGFDLELGENEQGKGAVNMKTYLFPQLKALATGLSKVDVVDSVVAKLAHGDDKMLTAWASLKSFLVSEGEDKIEPYFLAIDCVAPDKKPRFKLYPHTHANSLALARRIMSLGGSSSSSGGGGGAGSPADEALTQIWPLIMDMEDVPRAAMEDLEKPLNEADSKYCGLCFAFELTPGSAVPLVKMYVPIWQYARDEAGVVARYERIIKTQGMKMGDHGLDAALRDAFGSERETGMHTMASVSFSSKGVGLTTYFGPRFWE
ncbi:Indole prenyltransferase tdiB [Colletotrichum sidae]|uniref:Indole prenyltransferase tdiB n=1 Tax=Colletotrichum sidae TaxID=1347389 RepID=A0A4R8TLD3_9PEZI|nr:Indole prenyltransferase tdiB [Colletotrichum sidae]